MEEQVQEKKKVNYAFMALGSLRHDNLLFDRTCPSCGGMYSSRERSNCAKCNAALTYITSTEGKPMSMSEGTINLAFGHKQEARDNTAIEKRGGMYPTYRFKLFEFMDEHGVLTPPQYHDECRKGAKIEILMMNHQLVPKPFSTRKGEPRVELLIQVFTNYGDKLTMLTEQEYASRVVHHEVNPDGTPAALSNGVQNRLAYLEAEIAKIRGDVATPTPVPQHNAAGVVDDAHDPFAHAK